MDNIRRGFLLDPRFTSLVDEDLRTGQHSNPTGQNHYFTTAYFHPPDELQAEIKEAGFASSRVIAIEGIGWIPPSEAAEQRWNNEQFRNVVYQVIRLTETEPSALGASEHLMAVGLKP